MIAANVGEARFDRPSLFFPSPTLTLAVRRSSLRNFTMQVIGPQHYVVTTRRNANKTTRQHVTLMAFCRFGILFCCQHSKLSCHVAVLPSLCHWDGSSKD
jgi:hypothetical protein